MKITNKKTGIAAMAKYQVFFVYMLNLTTAKIEVKQVVFCMN
jgi:hypothetical protein